MAAEWITHKGKKILYINYGGLSEPDQLELIKTATKMLVDSGVKDNLSLTDVRGMQLSMEFVSLAKEMGRLSGAVTKRAAIVGVEGVRKVLLSAVNAVSGNPRKPFDTIEQAKDWLAE